MGALVAALVRPVRLWAARAGVRARRLGKGWGQAPRIALAVVSFITLHDERQVLVRLAAAAVLGGALSYPVWRAPHHGEPDVLRLRERQRRIAWRAAVLLLFAAVAVWLTPGAGTAASALALGAVLPPLVEPLAWRAWPASVRSAARRARGAQRYQEAAVGPGRLWRQRRRSGSGTGTGSGAGRVTGVGTATGIGTAPGRAGGGRTATPNWRPAGTRRPPRRSGAERDPFLPPGARGLTAGALGGFDPDAGAAGRPAPLPSYRPRRRKGPVPRHVDCRSHHRLLRWTPEDRELRLHHPAGQLVLPVAGVPVPETGVRAALARHPVAELVLYEESRPGTPTWRRNWLAFLDAQGYRVLELPGWGSDWATVARLADEADLPFARYLLPALPESGLEFRGPVSRALFPWRPFAWVATRRFRRTGPLDAERRTVRRR